MLAVRQELRPKMRGLEAALIERRYWRRRSSPHCDSIERVPEVARKNNDVVSVPRASAAIRHVANRLWNPAARIDPLQFSFREECNLSAIRGPKRRERVIRAR